MGRPHRIDVPGGSYHVLNRGVAQQTVFFEDRDRVEFERLLGVAHARFGLVVHSYCLMTNHYHLLVELPDGGLSESMHVLGSALVRHVNERQHRDGPLFRSRFQAKPVHDDAYLVRLVRYIHQNPLAFLDRAGLWRYRWSSLRVLQGNRAVPRWMRRDRILELVGGVDGLNRLVFDGTGVDVGCLPTDSWLDVVSLATDEIFGDAWRRGADRTVATLLLDQVDGPQRSELARLLDFPTDQAERSALSRARRRARDIPEYRRAVNEVLRFVA